jgi:hypothetical protein
MLLPERSGEGQGGRVISLALLVRGWRGDATRVERIDRVKEGGRAPTTLTTGLNLPS